MRNVSRRERRRCHLVQQRLEEVMVATVDDGHSHRRASQGTCGIQPPKTGTNNYHVGLLLGS
jgi:hypothetical protein